MTRSACGGVRGRSSVRSPGATRDRTARDRVESLRQSANPHLTIDAAHDTCGSGRSRPPWVAQPVPFEFRSPAALSVYPKRARRLTSSLTFVAALATTTAAALSPRRHHASHGVQHASMVSSTGSRSIGQHEPAMRMRLSYCSVRAPSRVSACTAAALSLCVCDSRVQNSRCLFKLGSSSRSSSSLTSVSVFGFSDLLSHTSSPPRSATPHASSS